MFKMYISALSSYENATNVYEAWIDSPLIVFPNMYTYLNN